MRCTRVLLYLSDPAAYRDAISFGLLVVIFVALSGSCRGQFGPLWIGAWQRYERGGAYEGTSPSASPEGASVVYSTPATGHGDIYSYDRTTKKNVRLTSDPEYDGSPSYSKDGKQIFFIREKDNVGHVWVMEADGSHQRQLTDGSLYDVGVSFAMDGKSCLLTRIEMKNGLSHVWVMEADGSHQRQLTDGPWLDGSPMFALDGPKVFFDREFPKGPVPQRLGPVVGKGSLRWPEIYSINADGSDLRQLTHNLHTDTPVCSAIDGKKLFYWRDDDYGKKSRFEGVSVMDADGTNSRDLGAGSTPAFSSDVRRIGFITGTYGRGVGLMNADGAGRRTIHRCKVYHSEPKFTPDGSYLIFVEWPEEHGSGRIIIQDIETSRIESVPSIE